MDMKTSEVKILLQKYYEGLTSPTEEADLESYFLAGETDPEFEADRLHFMAVAAMRDEDIPVPEDLEASVLSTLSAVQKTRVLGNRGIIYIAMSVAAGLMLMVSTVMFLSRQDSSQTVSDPQLAYAETRQALELVSKYFNEGTSELSGLNRINDAVKPLKKLNSLDEAIQSLSVIGKLENEK